MTNNIGFDNEKYLREQTKAILNRVNQFDNKLYLEFGGKLLYDYHAARVLPGFDPNVKMRLLQKLKDKIDVILCIYAGDIERKKIRADFGITYDADTLKTIDDFKEWGIDIKAVIITRYEGQQSARAFKNKLERRNVQVFTHKHTHGYPNDINTIVSNKGYGKNIPVKTTKPIVVVTGPGPGSGKLSTCLCHLYHEYKKGNQAGYAKFETFPVWNLPLKHKVNIAYESATADLKDVNLIDHFHLEAYNIEAVNYNRDIETFPVLKRIIEKITKTESFYKSPTDMGVNSVALGISSDEIVQEAAHQEIIRRYFKYSCEYATGLVDKEVLERSEIIMEKAGAKEKDRKVVTPARKAAKTARETNKGNKGVFCGAAIELNDGTIITGKNSHLMHASSSLIINAIKHIAGLPEDMHLLPENIIDSLQLLKKELLQGKRISLDLEETLIALSISAISNPAAQRAIEHLKDLRDNEVHITHIPTKGDEEGFRKLGINLTSDPDFSSKSLYLI